MQGQRDGHCSQQQVISWSSEQEGAMSCSQHQDQFVFPSRVYLYKNFPNTLLKQRHRN